MALQQLLKPASLLSKAKLGIGGIPGVIVGTIAIELVSQQIEARVPQSQQILQRQITSDAPFLGSVDVRDAGTLAFSIKELLKLVRKGKPNIKTILVNYGTKVILRQQGINPLPDKNKNQLLRKKFSYQLPMP